MSHPSQMNMGGPVGGIAAQPPMHNAGTPGSGGGGGGTPQTPIDPIKRLNTAIYDYLLRNSLYDVARAFYNSKLEIETDIKKSPGSRPGAQANGIGVGGVEEMDVDSDEIKNRPSDLPAPIPLADGPFLQDWWCQFWEIWHGQRRVGNTPPSTLQYIGAQRQAQKQRTALLASQGIDPATMQNMRGLNNMMPLNNGMGMVGGDLKRAAMQNPRNMTPQQVQQMQQMRNMQAANQAQLMQANQMERQGSQMDLGGPRSGSPNAGDAPSPKRQRLEANMAPQMGPGGRPGPPGQIPGNQSVNTYSSSMKQSHQAAMENLQNNSNAINKGPMHPNAAALQASMQGSPMAQAGMDAANSEFYAAAAAANNARMLPGGAAGVGQPGGNTGNHALQDYQMQLMLLEQQNKKRLLMARQEQDSMTQPTGMPGPNGQQFAAPGMSPQGSRTGDPSPGQADMQRGTPKIGKAGMSPNGDLAARGSPQPGMMGPGGMVPPELRQQMLQNGQMRPPSSHPMMTPEQLAMFQGPRPLGAGMQMPNGVWQPGQPGPTGPLMPGQQPAGPSQPGGAPPNATPRQSNMAPPPPPGPQGAAGTQPNSPAQPPAPPTPSQATKTKANAKKAEAKKGAANKKGSVAGAAAASESEAPPTPTPATPITPMHQNSFNHHQNKQLPNGQQAAPQPPTQPNPAANPPGQPAPAPAGDVGQPFGNIEPNQFPEMNMDFADLGGNGDVLDSFDFDSFLNNTDGDNGLGFDAFPFGDTAGLEAGADLGGN